MNKKGLLGCGIGILLLCCVAVVGTAVVLSNARVFEPSGVTTELTAPQNAPLKDPFVIEISITNDAAEDQILDSIDLPTAYLAGIELQSTTPAYTDEFAIPFVKFHSYTFNQNIEQFETLIVEFVMEGQQEGLFEGEVDVCINDGSSCQTIEISTAIGNSSGR